MARVNVTFEEYQEGRLPPVCVLSGERADRMVTYRTQIPRRRGGEVTPGRLLRALESLVDLLDVRRSQDLLLGRLPVSSEVYRRLRRSRQVWTAVLRVSAVTLLVAAWVGAAWSPAVAILSIVAIGLAVRGRQRWHRAQPRATLTHGGGLVTIDNVHEDFAAATRSRF